MDLVETIVLQYCIAKTLQINFYHFLKLNGKNIGQETLSLKMKQTT